MVLYQDGFMQVREIVGGDRLENAVARLVEAATGGKTQVAVFWNVTIVANPGQTAEEIIRRFQEDVAAKGRWFDTEAGRTFVASRKAG